MTISQRAQCPDCLKWIVVLPDGTLREHSWSNGQRIGDRDPVCPSSGKAAQ